MGAGRTRDKGKRGKGEKGKKGKGERPGQSERADLQSTVPTP